MSGRSDIGACNSNRRTSTKTNVLPKQNSNTNNNKRANNNKEAKCTTCRFKRSKSSSSPIMRYLKALGRKVVATFRMMSPKKSSPKVTSSASSESTAKLPPPPPPVDSHRAEAIDDCIQFINSSSSLPRSNSVSCQGH